MGDYYEDDAYYYDENMFVPGPPRGLEWSASSPDGTPMTREPSGESVNSTYSSTVVQDPGPGYGASYAAWSPVSPVDQNPLWPSSMPEPSQEFMSSATSYDLPFTSDYRARNGSDYNTGAQSSWFTYYEFVTDVQPGQEPYWRLRPGLEPTDRLPAIRPAENTSPADPHRRRSHDQCSCLHPGCGKRFGRKADLQRHLAQVHTPKEEKLKLPCDYKRCSRAKECFGRNDHRRAHWRDYHNEDLLRRGSSGEDLSWWQSRNINLEWWRCASCLIRVKVGDYGYTCPSCQKSCEPERRRYRQAL